MSKDCFLVVWESDDDLIKLNSILKEDKYDFKGHVHAPAEFDNYVCNWIFMNLSQKVAYKGSPGIAYAPVIGEHAIKVNEFIIIRNIYKKYEGLKLREFNKNLAE